jgi:hypothetical protein
MPQPTVLLRNFLPVSGQWNALRRIIPETFSRTDSLCEPSNLLLSLSHIDGSDYVNSLATRKIATVD